MKTRIEAQRHKVAKAQSASVPLCLCAFVPLYLCIVSTGSAFAAGVEIADSTGSGLIGRWTFDDLTDGVLKDSTRIALDATVRGDVSLEDGVFAAAARLSRRKLIAWVDAMCPYRGDQEVRQIDDPEFQGIDWLAIRPQIKNAPVVVRPGPIDSGP